MVKIISFEGGVGVGKTSLTNYFSHELKISKILEKYDINPFLKEFYRENSNVNLETEITFLLIHYSQIKNALKDCQDLFLIADFSIEKDLVYAKLNLESNELSIFKSVYDYIIKKVGAPYLVFYLNLSPKTLKQRIFHRGREYEMNANPKYFKDFDDKIKQFFKTEARSKIYFFDVDDLELDQHNKKLGQIRTRILEAIK